MFDRRAARKERQRLMQGRPNFEVHFSRTVLAASLWDHGEDDLADRALVVTDADLKQIQNIAAHYEDPAYELPVVGQRITHNHVSALAAVTFFEGAVRPLSRSRRRSQKDRPAKFAPSPTDPSPGL